MAANITTILIVAEQPKQILLECARSISLNGKKKVVKTVVFVPLCNEPQSYDFGGNRQLNFAVTTLFSNCAYLHIHLSKWEENVISNVIGWRHLSHFTNEYEYLNYFRV